METERHKRFRGRGATRRSAGFSLVEMVVVIIATGIIVVSIGPFLKANVHAYMTTRAGKEMLEASRIGFNIMVNEMRRIQDPATDFDFAYSDDIQFDFLNPDGLTYTTDVEYEYDSNSGRLVRNGQRLVEGVSSLTFTYYRQNNTSFSPGLWDTDEIWRIKVKMVVGAEGDKFTLTQEFFPKGFINSVGVI